MLTGSAAIISSICPSITASRATAAIRCSPIIHPIWVKTNRNKQNFIGAAAYFIKHKRPFLLTVFRARFSLHLLRGLPCFRCIPLLLHAASSCITALCFSNHQYNTREQYGSCCRSTGQYRRRQLCSFGPSFFPCIPVFFGKKVYVPVLILPIPQG